jgi:hypothetical protein
MPTVWSETTKTVSEDSFMLKQDSDFLLLETGDYIVIAYGINWTETAKN